MISEKRMEQARKRLARMYRRLQSWRAVAEEIGVSNMSYPYNFVKDGKLPKDERIRKALLEAKRQGPLSMSEEQARLVHYLESHKGRERAVKKWDLVVMMFGQDARGSVVMERKLRALIEAVNHDHGGLIGSDNTAGYFWISSLEEGVQVADAARDRAQTVKDNADQLERNVRAAYGDQHRLLP